MPATPANNKPNVLSLKNDLNKKYPTTAPIGSDKPDKNE
jgi:hypothetical protein